MSASVPQSPYDGIPPAEWENRTEELLADYPIPRTEVVEVVLQEWASIFESGIGTNRLRIGEHLFPSPQVMGNYLHELVPYELRRRYPEGWRRDETGADKDLVWVADPDRWSTEIKTSSHKNQVFGNRSYAQAGNSKKTKSGFYLTINFEKWSDCHPGELPKVRLIRLGWLDHTDWIPQKAPTGQNARISKEAYAGKLSELFRE